MEVLTDRPVKRKDRMTYDMAFEINGKTPPQAIHVEEAILGALMLDQDALTNTIELLRKEFFYKPEHQYIFGAITQLFTDGSPVDLMTIMETLRKNGELELAGGPYYLAQLSNHVVSSAHAEYHARILAEKFIQRELIRISTETITSAYDETTDVMSLLDKTEQQLMDINDKNFHTDNRSIGTIGPEAYSKIISNQEKGNDGLSGLPSGIIGLDRVTSGFQPGTLIILAARPGMGKTALAVTMARNMAVEQNEPVAIFSLEMPAEELVMRLISSETDIPGEKLKKGTKLSTDEQERLQVKTTSLFQAPIYIDDTSTLTIFELRAKCRRLKERHGIKMVFIDYLQLMSGSMDHKNGNREQEIANISRQLKSLSKELSIPIMALSQLSRAVETRGGTKKPQLSDLRESGSIEQDADMVLFVYRPDYYDQTTDELPLINIAKHRSGSLADVPVKFVKEFVRFENPDQYDLGGGMPINSGFDSRPNTIELGSAMNNDNPFSPNTDFDNIGGGNQNFMPADEDSPF